MSEYRVEQRDGHSYRSFPWIVRDRHGEAVAYTLLRADAERIALGLRLLEAAEALRKSFEHHMVQP